MYVGTTYLGDGVSVHREILHCLFVIYFSLKIVSVHREILHWLFVIYFTLKLVSL